MWRRFVTALVFGALAVGTYFAVRKHLLPAPDQESALVAQEVENDQQRALERWRGQGAEGWEHLFESASQALPGYVVDVGRRPREQLAQIGPRLRPMLIEKLKSHNYNERITAIHLLARLGEPSARITQLLRRELKGATARMHEIGALKCATTIPNAEPVLIELSLAALASEHPGTRQLAVAYLFQLRSDPHAPADLSKRLLALLDDDDLKVRVLAAIRLTEEGAPRSYQILLDAVNSDNRSVVLGVANHVAKLRGGGRIDPLTSTEAQVEKALEGHRRWLKDKLRP